MFCSRCAGTGEILGNGMIMIECNQCEGLGEYYEQKEPKKVEIDKKSKPYKDAIKEIMALNPEISKEEAAKMFEETYDKV